MKIALVIALGALCAVAAATPTNPWTFGVGHKYKTSDKVFLQKQKDVLRLLKYVNQPTYYKDFVEIAKGYNLESSVELYTHKNCVKDFFRVYKVGFLPRGEIFSVFNEYHLKQAITLFNLFYYAKDYDTFFKTAVWARNHINEGIFLYSFSVAVIHRPDLRGIVLPPIYEIYPYYFVNSDVISKAQTLKQLYGGVKDRDTVKQVDIPYSTADGDGYVIYGNYSGWYVKASPEQKLSYFTEDVGINSFYYYYNLYFPYWMNVKEYNMPFERRGEYFYYFYQQLLARYYLERLSNGLGSIGYFDFDKYVQTPFYSSLQYPSGLEFPLRKEYAYFYHYGGNQATYNDDVSYFKSKQIQFYETRIMDSIDYGFVFLEDGTRVNLYDPKGLEILGNAIEGNKQSVNSRFYGSLYVFFRTLLGHSYYPSDKYHLAPSALEHFETSLRDPVFYEFFKRILVYFQKYKWNLPKYTYDELVYQGVKVEGVTFDKLYTFFDNYDIDLTHSVFVNEREFETDSFPIKARYERLNHKPFIYKVQVASDKASKVVVRTFFGPKYDEFGNVISFDKNRINFIELDKFVYTLGVGKNVIERNSREFYYYGSDRTTYKTLYGRVLGALKGDGEFNIDGSETSFAFPRRFILPKGKVGGQTFQVYVYISPYTEETTYKVSEEHYFYPFYSFDARPYGYPLDRPIDYYSFFVPNSYLTDVVVYFKGNDYKQFTDKSDYLDTY